MAVSDSAQDLKYLMTRIDKDCRGELKADTFGAIAGGVAEEFYKGFGKVDAEGILKKYLTPELYEILIA